MKRRRTRPSSKRHFRELLLEEIGCVNAPFSPNLEIDLWPLRTEEPPAPISPRLHRTREVGLKFHPSAAVQVRRSPRYYIVPKIVNGEISFVPAEGDEYGKFSYLGIIDYYQEERDGTSRPGNDISQYALIGYSSLATFSIEPQVNLTVEVLENGKLPDAVLAIRAQKFAERFTEGVVRQVLTNLSKKEVEFAHGELKGLHLPLFSFDTYETSGGPDHF